MKPGIPQVTLSSEIARKIEEKMSHTIKGIEETLNEILRRGEIEFTEFKAMLESLEPGFTLLSQKWVLEILYSLLVKGPLGFNELKSLTGASSRSLSLKLKSLIKLRYVERRVKTEPPMRTTYYLTEKGKNAALLSLPLIYYIAKTRDE